MFHLVIFSVVHFFQAIVLKLCVGYVVYITENVWNVFAILPVLICFMGKNVFFQLWIVLFVKGFLGQLNP